MILNLIMGFGTLLQIYFGYEILPDLQYKKEGKD